MCQGHPCRHAGAGHRRRRGRRDATYTWCGEVANYTMDKHETMELPMSECAAVVISEICENQLRPVWKIGPGWFFKLLG